MRLAVAVAAAALLLAGCGSQKSDPYEQANLALLDTLPVYPGAAAPKTTTSGSADTKFAARDWTLPAKATAPRVVRWYQAQLPKRGWRISGESFGTVHATRGGASVSVGVRGRTLEAVANSRGA